MLGGTIFVRSKVSFKLPDEKNILVLGDSYTECAVDDNILTRAANVSQSGTAYIYSYCKLKKFLEENPHIDTVLLSFHYDVLTEIIDNLWIFGKSVLSDRLSKYLLFLGNEEFAVYGNKKNLIASVLQMPVYSMGSIVKFLMQGSLSYKDAGMGCYLNLDRNKLEKAIANDKTNERDRRDRISSIQKNYLLKIAELCKSKGIRLILISTPTYNAEQYGSTDKLWNYYNNYLSDVQFIDYSKFSLPDSCYADIGHLNRHGARIFSQYLEKEINPKWNETI
jgi:hypothetical protein